MGVIALSPFRVSNALAPDEDKGPTILSTRLDFTALGSAKIDLVKEEATDRMPVGVQSIFIDNSENPQPLVMVVGVTQQRVKIPANKQGVFPVYSNGDTDFTFTTTAGAGIIIPIIFANFPQPYAVW